MESVRALLDPRAYPHAVDRVELVETHISWVLLAGDFAYKVKKPVKLAFLDFGSLVSRRFFCHEELRLNRRTAPDLYLDVVPIAGEPPRIGGAGEAIDYAVKMRRFPREALLDGMAARGELEAAHIDALAARVADLHARAERAPAEALHDVQRLAASPAFENFSEIDELASGLNAHRRLSVLRAWTARESLALGRDFASRHAGGFVRECHGDLHLGNVALVGGTPLPFDAIEFSPRLRWIDVMSDVAFVVMDLVKHGEPRLAWRFLNAYLELTGDHGGLRVLRFYLVYRAMVRAKVAAIRGDAGEFNAYLDIAGGLADDERPSLVAMHGPSASGKTHVSQYLLESLGAVRLRSDVERKRMHGIDALESAAGAPGEGIYSQGEGRRAYARLAELAAGILAAGFPVVVDGTCLERSQRDLFESVALHARVPFRVVSCAAPPGLLRERVRGRAGTRNASDATLAVLDLQLATRQPLGADEHAHALVLDTAGDTAWKAALQRVIRDLRRDTVHY